MGTRINKVLITGARGFIGKNLSTRLKELGGITVYEFDIDDSGESLENYLKEADFVYHLAGVNRPKKEEEFITGNLEFTRRLTTAIESLGRKLPILISSSTQAELDNPYGRSKKAAEEEILDYCIRNSTPVYIYRLPNVFGKWCRPNYNSVVATFCYRISRNLQIWLSDPQKKLTLVYIDDVIDSFLAHLDEKGEKLSGYCQVNKSYDITLGKLAEKLTAFRGMRNTLRIPDLSGDFEKKLYATYLSYLGVDDFSYGLNKKEDNRGWLAEIMKSKEFGQIFVSKTHKGVVRGNHYHHTKVEKFLVIQGEALISFRKIGSEGSITYNVSGERPEIVDIPPGYTHSIESIGEEELITLFWASEIFDADSPDTYYCEV
jgi:UDP-2-acetamido-2,6-beta-L-arabino-hexul-4-ose reductase